MSTRILRNLSRFCVLLFFCFSAFSCSSKDSTSSTAQETSNSVATVQARDFAPGQLEAHYEKHGYQFGNITQDQYLQDAQALLDAAPDKDVLERIRPNGDIEHFRASTGEFADMTKRGRIRTYFKTDFGYWMREDNGR
jgi:pyocin large subunit-like protein